ncbi:MAG TPA: carboxypeptidase-like regulatory domain-containing protein, partial [Gemmataceae bacterium]|nr:carboxypeptidase-like regulatory domain-containing protein [Gemmataceae bacterium]
PAPPKAVEVTAVAENGVGLRTPRVVRIELVDPKGGTIAATIKRGGRPQAGVEVSLRDNEGKEKGVLKTDAKGVARFVNLPPGPYRLYAGKPDASTGLIGNTVATIPDPPPTRAIEIDLDLAKRR